MRAGGQEQTPGLFATGSLARRVERAEVTLIEDGAAASRRRISDTQLLVMPIAGGVAVFTEPGSPFNKVVGLGFDGVPEECALDLVERALAERQSPVQIELSTLGDPTIARLATRRGYELIGFENVLGLPLTAETAPAMATPRSDGPIQITRADASDNATWLDTVTTGFLHPDAFDGPASHESFDRAALERVYTDTMAAPSFERYLAFRAGQIAGGATLRVSEGVAQLCGASTLPEHRRHGVQTALLRHRIASAAQRGCDIAVVTTQPGSKSQQNVQRFGFTLLYARAILVKSPAGS